MTWTPLGCDPACNGTLTVDGFSLNTPAWMVENVSKLWFEANVRGDNRRIPEMSGVVPYPRRLDETTVDLVFHVTGLVDETGAAWPTAWEGLDENLETLWTNVFSPVTTGDGTRPCVLTTPHGITRTADVQFLPLRARRDVDDARLATFLMTLVIPAGRFARV